MTLAEVNPAVNLLLSGAAFERTNTGQLYLVQPGDKYYPRLRWRLRQDRLWPYDRVSATFTGGTTLPALTQLSLWLLDHPRLGLGWWQRITGPRIWPEGEAERGAKLLEYLRQSSYPAASKTCCVFCASSPTGDWWCQKGGPIGPYCGCKDTRKGGDK